MAKSKLVLLARPCDRSFVVSPEKSEEFKNLKPNYTKREKNRITLEKLKITNLVNDEKIKKPEKRKIYKR